MIIIRSIYNIQNICTIFILVKDNIDYFPRDVPIRFILYKDIISSIDHNKNCFNVKTIHKNKQYKLLDLDDFQFNTLKSTSKYNIEYIDFIFLLRSAGIDIEAVNNDNNKLLYYLSLYLINYNENNTKISILNDVEYNTLSDNTPSDNTPSDNTPSDINYIIDYTNAKSINEITKNIHYELMKKLNINNMKIKFIYILQNINIFLFILIYIIFVYIFILYIQK